MQLNSAGVQGNKSEKGLRRFRRNPWLIVGELEWGRGQNHDIIGPVPGFGGHEHSYLSKNSFQIPSKAEVFRVMGLE